MAKRSYRRVRYTGELATPIRLQGHEGDDAAITALDNKLKALASLYHVDLDGPNACWDLTIALAQAHVPGFRLKRARGGARREATWLAGLGEWLRWEVDATKKEFDCTIVQAIARLRADKSKPWHKHKPQTLAARYREADRRYRSGSPRDRIAWALLARDARQSATDLRPRTVV